MTEYIFLQEAFVILFSPVVGLLLALFLASAIITAMVLMSRGKRKPLDVHIVSRDDE